MNTEVNTRDVKLYWTQQKCSSHTDKESNPQEQEREEAQGGEQTLEGGYPLLELPPYTGCDACGLRHTCRQLCC